MTRPSIVRREVQSRQREMLFEHISYQDDHHRITSVARPEYTTNTDRTGRTRRPDIYTDQTYTQQSISSSQMHGEPAQPNEEHNEEKNENGTNDTRYQVPFRLVVVVVSTTSFENITRRSTEPTLQPRLQLSELPSPF